MERSLNLKLFQILKQIHSKEWLYTQIGEKNFKDENLGQYPGISLPAARLATHIHWECISK